MRLPQRLLLRRIQGALDDVVAANVPGAEVRVHNRNREEDVGAVGVSYGATKRLPRMMTMDLRLGAGVRTGIHRIEHVGVGGAGGGGSEDEDEERGEMDGGVR